jgi:hypothetical protein
MTGQSFILFPGPASWTVGAVRDGRVSLTHLTIADGATPAQIAPLVPAALHDSGHAGEGIVLAIPSSWCFSASIAVGDLPRHDRKAMLYRLEEKLPLAAELVIADFVHHAPGCDTALGVCVQTEKVRPFVEALESAGVAIMSISSAPLLAVQEMIRAELPSDNQSLRLILLGEKEDRSRIDLVVVDGSTPVGWSLVPANAHDIKFQINMALMESEDEPKIEACDIDAMLVASIGDAVGQSIASRDGSVFDAAARCADEIGAGRIAPWVEFRRDALAIDDPLAMHRKPLNFLLASCVALVLAIAAGMWMRAERYEHAAKSSEQKMVDAFTAQFPGWAIPANVKAVIVSEHAKSGIAGGASLPVESGRSALQTLDDVIGKLPAEARFTINQMTLEDSSFEIQGRIRSYEDVDAIAAAARKAGMDVPSPQARKDADGFWSFTLRGTRSIKPGNELAKSAGE